jgi:cytochrome P450
MERKYDLHSATFKANSYETFAQMRQDHPIWQQPGRDGKTLIWFVTRYDEADMILRDDKRFTRDFHAILPPEQVAKLIGSGSDPIFRLVSNHMLAKDGTDHQRLRALVSKAFTPRMVSQMRPRIQAIADELLDPIAVQGEADLIETYAFPLPVIVIAELLGIPATDRDKFRTWSNAILTPAMTHAAQAEFLTHVQAFVTYLRQLFEQRRQDPQPDLISALLQAEEAGDRLSEEEMFSTVILLIIAGYETTVNLIGNATLALLQHPEQMAQLRENPEQMATAVEEFLRYDGPAEMAQTRWATEEVEINGRTIQPGDPINVIIGAANRDPAQFEDPNRLDIERNPTRHLAFGRGSHYCLGAPLARLEGEIALNTLLRRLPNLRLAVDPDELNWRLIPFFHGLDALPIKWDT